MTGQNNFNANKQAVTVYDADKNEHIVSRPNARELVATGKYFWASTDIGKDRLETDGPEDPSAEVMTIYDQDGNPQEATRANARDLVAGGKFTWVPAHAETETSSDDDEKSDDADAPTAPVVTEDSPADEPLDPVNSSLASIAQRVAGNDDVSAYLDGFPVETLRDMAMQRYGEKVHHRASKENVITKMIELEEAKLDAQDAEASGESNED